MHAKDLPLFAPTVTTGSECLLPKLKLTVPANHPPAVFFFSSSVFNVLTLCPLPCRFNPHRDLKGETIFLLLT